MSARIRLLAGLLGLLLACLPAAAAEPLRVFIRGGIKTHGPNQHDHPRFLGDWTRLLGERGVKVSGAMTFPTAEQLAETDVLVIYAADGMKIVGAEREHFETFLRRGGGVVVLHDGVVSDDQHVWCKEVIGGAWIWKRNAPDKAGTTWHEGEVGVYVVDADHPITRGLSNFDWKDEVYNQMDMADDVRVLAQSFVDVFNIWPQMWTYEKTRPGGERPYRAFVSLPGHEYDVFNTPHYRAVLLRGIAWAGGMANTDALCRPEELNSLRYPEGGPLPATLAMAKMDVHPEFGVTLAADENVAEKIMSLDWDPQGRLWVVETPEYPGGLDVNKNDFKAYWNRRLDPDRYPAGARESRKPKDRVSILEDTNGDGVMDRKTVFADGLELPTSLVFYKDGVIVSQAPDILWIRDTNGDGRADKVETLFTGWGTFDTHAVINNFKWGLDGWVYGTVGYTRGNVKSGDGRRSFGEFSAGAFRFRPDGSAIEQVSANGCNTWGIDITPDNEVIYTTATCGTPILHVVVPERYLARGNVGGVTAWKNIIEENKIFPPFAEKRQPYVQIDWVGAWTAAAGATVYDGGAWPGKWAPEGRYSFFMSEATMHLFHHQFLDPAGATFQGRKEDGRKDKEFLTGGPDYWFRPIHSRVGPDGALYLVDFYNQIAVHNDTRGPAHGARNAATRPDRDHHFTRLYRIQHREARALPAFRLDPADPAGLVAMLRHPNGWVRTTANRLLVERPDRLASVQEDLGELIMDREASAFARIQALWLYANLARTHEVAWDADVARALMADADPAVRINVLRVAAALGEGTRVGGDAAERARVAEEGVIAALRDSHGRVQINALMAASDLKPSPALARAVVAAWPSLKDDKWRQSAAVAAASADPILYLEAAFQSADPAFLADLMPHLARLVANRGDAPLAARAVELLARQPAATDALKAVALEALADRLAADVRPSPTAPLQAALRSLLGGERTAGSALPLVARWNLADALSAELRPAVGRALASLKDAGLPDAQRGRTAANLVALRSLDASILPALAGILGSDASDALQKLVIDALGTVPEGGDALVGAFPRLRAALLEPAFGQVIKRTGSTATFLDAIEAKRVDAMTLGPARLHRLRTHGDTALAKRAEAVIEGLRGPEAKEKDALIARLTPVVTRPGDVAKGRELYAANCAGCHVYKGEGRNLAPDLTGMGAHGPADLLIHIVDPNRVVEANFIAYGIETRSGDQYNGIIDRENASEVVLRDATTDHTLRTSEIVSKVSTGRSLMPEGFETLGDEALRDLLAYLCADDSRFRILDLTKAFTANSARGLYITPENPDDTVTFNRYGIRRAGEVPFDVISPEKAGANVIVLKGGARDSWSRRTLPQRVEIPVGVAASRLHFLGGIAGWGHPAVSEKIDAVRVTLVFAGGRTQEIVLRNGVEIADYRGRPDVDGSQRLNWTRGPGQIRWFSKDVTVPGVIEKLVLESYDNAVAPTFFGITAELGEARPAPAAPAAAPAAAKPAAKAATVTWGEGLKVLLIGGGASHDYNRWFNLADVRMLNETGGIDTHYREPQDLVAADVQAADVLVISANKAFPDPEVRKAVFAHAEAGKGLVLLHPGLWYNWADWPEYNRTLAGGGARGHDRYGEFRVAVIEPGHPLVRDVPPEFTLADELYYFDADPAGAKIHVLATAHSKSKDRTYPQVFTVAHDTARIAGITLGHDGVAHSHPAYQRLLRNAVAWVARK